MENKEIWDKLNNHEQRITKNEGDISNIKIDTSVQGEAIKNMSVSMERLTVSMDKLSDKLENFLVDNGKTGADNWKWIVSVILIPVILFLLKIIFKC